jgi:hypothetical protein
MNDDLIIIEVVKCPVCGMNVQYDCRSMDEFQALSSHISRLDMTIVLKKYGYIRTSNGG